MHCDHRIVEWYQLIHFRKLFSPIDSITLTPEEGSGSVELVSGGRNIQVNETNVYDYVRLYANYRLLKTHEKSLEVFYPSKSRFEDIC